jgi:hypothetical protein
LAQPSWWQEEHMRKPRVAAGCTGLLRIALFVLLLAAPSVAWAQGTLTGTVRDASGGVLPGVTVEAASPVLIEKVRTVVTDSAGIYRVVDLNPGTYSLTFTLPGFTVVRREEIQLGGSATLTIPVEMRVGNLQETITVTGETPVVDVQTVRRQVVLDADVIQTLPGTRTVGSLLNATPGLQVDNNGLAATPTMTFFTARGGPTNEGRMAVNGMTVAAAFNGGGVSSYILDSVNVDEVSVTVSGGLGESDIGGPVMNLVPRSGGNTFRGQAFINNAGDWSRGENLDDDLRAVGIDETPGIIKSYDGSVSYGGPIMRDRLWFFGSYRRLNTETAVEGIRGNANMGDLSRWDWVEDPTTIARRSQGRSMYIGRFTAQATDKHRITFSHEYQLRCEGSPLFTETDGCHRRPAEWIAAGSATTSPEANLNYLDFPYYLTQALWTAPVTNKVLLEAGFSRLSYGHAGGPGQLPPDGIFDITVLEQSTATNPATGLPYAPRANYSYRALAGYSDNVGTPYHWRASLSYVTGSHNMKVGYQGSHLISEFKNLRNPSLLNYRFNRGAPNQFTMAIPDWTTSDRTKVAAFYVQDTWTRGRLTLQGALRYDRAWSYSPSEHNGTTTASRVNPAPITFDETVSVSGFNDLTPRFGLAFDVFGNGRTALKFNMGHYLDSATNDSAYTRNNPANRIVRTVSRSWTDNDGDKVVDCDLLNFALQNPANGSADTCGALTGNNLNFGSVGQGLTQVNQDTLHGWGVRENDWQWGLTVQQELVPRVSLEVGYARRWFQGFTVTDNLNRDPSQYDSWTIAAPSDSRLPGGGGYPITTYVPTDAAAAIAAQDYITFETDFGPARTNYWHGVDVTLNARLRQGLTFQVGTSTGRSVVDTCATSTRIDSPDPRNCHDADPIETTLRGLGSYTIPKVDVLVSATLRSQSPLVRSAAWPVPNSVVTQLLGRLPRGATANGNTTVQLIDNDHRLFAEKRRTQIDMRFAKVVRFGATRTDVGVDIGNLLNTNYATAFENTYQYSTGNVDAGGTWNNPTAVYTPRFVRLNFTVNF